MFWFVLICFSLFCVPNVDISASDVAESVVDVTVSAVGVTSQPVLLSASSALFLLFGEVWSREDKLPARDRSIVTVTALMASGVLDSSLAFHIGEAKKNGVTKEEMTEILTHAAFYAGWPKAWAAFRMAKEIYQD